MRNLILQYSHSRRILFLGLLLIVNIGLFFLPGLPGSISRVTQTAPDQKIPDVMGLYTPNEVYVFLTSIETGGREAYQQLHLTTDLALPLLYGLLFFAVISRLVIVLNIEELFLPFLSIIASGFDLAENFTLDFLTNQYPETLGTLVEISQLFTLGKFTFLFVNCIIVIFLGLKFIQRHRNDAS